MMKTADYAALKERPKRVNMSGMDVAPDVFALTMPDGFMLVALFLQEPVAGMLVGRYERDPIRDSFTDKVIQGRGVGIGDHLRHDHALTGDSADHSDFASGATSQLAALEFVLILFLTADKGLVYFYFTVKLDSITAHRRTPAVAHIPSGVVVRAGIFAKDNTVDLQGANPLLSDEHQISDLEPEFQRNFGILKNGVGKDGKAVSVPTATINVLAQPMVRPRFERINLLRGIATRAMDNPIRPAHVHQELAARFFGRKLSVKSINCLHAYDYNNSWGGCQYPPNPLAKGGMILTPLWKRGEGEIFDPNAVAIIQRISDTPH